jgi:hypothetical protein
MSGSNGKAWLAEPHNDDLVVEFRVRRSAEFRELFGFVGDIRLMLEDQLPADVSSQELDEEGMLSLGNVVGSLVVNASDPAHLTDVADSVSDDVFKLVNLPWVEDELIIEGFGEEMPFSTWVGVDRMEIHPRWRGFRIGYAAMREVVRLFGAGDNTLITVHPHPLMTEEVRQLAPSELETGRRKLNRYWSDFGLSAVNGTEILAHDCRLRWPAGSWMRTHDESD